MDACASHVFVIIIALRESYRHCFIFSFCVNDLGFLFIRRLRMLPPSACLSPPAISTRAHAPWIYSLRIRDHNPRLVPKSQPLYLPVCDPTLRPNRHLK